MAGGAIEGARSCFLDLASMEPTDADLAGAGSIRLPNSLDSPPRNASSPRSAANADVKPEEPLYAASPSFMVEADPAGRKELPRFMDVEGRSAPWLSERDAQREAGFAEKPRPLPFVGVSTVSMLWKFMQSSAS